MAIKSVKLSISHLNQLLAYMSQREQLVEGICSRLGVNIAPNRWIGILTGPAIAATLGAALVNGTWPSLPGIIQSAAGTEIRAVVINRFREVGSNAIYVFSDKYFPIRSSSTGVDYSKFSFDDRVHWYGAGEFVRQYIHEYSSQANCRDLATLQKLFPKNLQGRYEVVASPISIVDPLRYSKQSFRVGNDTYEICTQWGFAHGQGNLKGFIDFAKKQGASIYRMTPDSIVTLL